MASNRRGMAKGQFFSSRLENRGEAFRPAGKVDDYHAVKGDIGEAAGLGGGGCAASAGDFFYRRVRE